MHRLKSLITLSVTVHIKYLWRRVMPQVGNYTEEISCVFGEISGVIVLVPILPWKLNLVSLQRRSNILHHYLMMMIQPEKWFMLRILNFRPRVYTWHLGHLWDYVKQWTVTSAAFWEEGRLTCCSSVPWLIYMHSKILISMDPNKSTADSGKMVSEVHVFTHINYIFICFNMYIQKYIPDFYT
jgi:hypothetical protein